MYVFCIIQILSAVHRRFKKSHKSSHTPTSWTYASQNTEPKFVILVTSVLQFTFNLYLGLMHGNTFRSAVKKLDPLSI